MKKKLTLHLDARIIEQANVYAQNHQVSLYKLIESYLHSLTDNESEDIAITPLVESLSGVVAIPQDFAYKKKYTGFLLEKHQ